jgi:TfoX/Sxy family transcriptional regulator of competence genes
MKNSAPTDPDVRYSRLVKALIKNPDVMQPIGKKGFGRSGLYVHGKLFAFLSYKKQLIVKVPRERVNELVARGDGARWNPRRDGRVLKEWIVLKPSSKLEWLPLAKEAKDFVASQVQLAPADTKSRIKSSQ